VTDSSSGPWRADIEPELCGQGEGHDALTLLVWRFAEPRLVVSSAPLGGGLGRRHWIVNAQVPHSYVRLDPDVHLTELASARRLTGPGVGMLTAVDLRQTRCEVDGGARVDVSVGVTLPTWAAGPDEPPDRHRAIPGTINIVAVVPEQLSPAALVNAVVTVTEAKAQALWESGIAATGTASDAVCVVCPEDGPVHPFGGPRSTWGARLARAVHRAVVAGCGGRVGS
jgi:adenosylcobinamide hydrolase